MARGKIDVQQIGWDETISEIIKINNSLHIGDYIYHYEDTDTYILFEDDTLILAAGGRSFIKLEEASQDKLIVNHGGLNIDLKVSGQNNANLIRTDAANDKVGIATGSPETELHINGSLTLTERSSDPSNPAEGNCVLWMSDGTGSGDDGDVMIKITAGGSTKTVTLVDFSAS